MIIQPLRSIRRIIYANSIALYNDTTWHDAQLGDWVGKSAVVSQVLKTDAFRKQVDQEKLQELDRFPCQNLDERKL